MPIQFKVKHTFLLTFLLLFAYQSELHAQIKKSALFGGKQGSEFETTCKTVSEIQVKTGSWVEKISVFCEKETVNPENNSIISTIHRFQFEPDEYLTELRGTQSGGLLSAVESIQFVTNKRQSSVFGKKGKEPFSIVIPSGYRFIGLFGRASLSLNAIGVVMEEVKEAKPQSEIFGGNSGNAFQSFLTKITEIQVRAGDWIDGISIVNSTGETRTFGGNGGTVNRFTLLPNEKITRVSLSYAGKGGNYIHNIQFHTNLRSSPKYGKFAGSQTKEIQVPAGFLVAGFTGRVGKYIDALGLLFEPDPTPAKTASAPIAAPSPFQPKPNEVLDNACSEGRDKLEWIFAWEPKNGATLYHLQVFDLKQNLILNEQAIQSPSYAYSQALPIEQNMLYNWSWQIRAQIGGEWSEWSAKSYFSIEPPNSDCGGTPAAPAPNLTQGLPTNTPQTNTQQPSPSTAVTGLFPLPNSVLDNGCDNREDPLDWFFYWLPITNATSYHFEVYHEGEPPIISETKLRSNFYSFNTKGNVENQKLSNWNWRVRAQVNGVWSEWVNQPFSIEGNNNDCNPGNPQSKPREFIVIDNQSPNAVEATVEFRQGNVFRKLFVKDFNTRKKQSIKLPKDAASVQVSVYYSDKGLWRSLGQLETDDSEYSQCFIIRQAPSLNGASNLVLDRLSGEYCK